MKNSYELLADESNLSDVVTGTTTIFADVVDVVLVDEASVVDDGLVDEEVPRSSSCDFARRVGDGTLGEILDSVGSEEVKSVDESVVDESVVGGDVEDVTEATETLLRTEESVGDEIDENPVSCDSGADDTVGAAVTTSTGEVVGSRVKRVVASPLTTGPNPTAIDNSGIKVGPEVPNNNGIILVGTTAKGSASSELIACSPLSTTPTQ